MRESTFQNKIIRILKALPECYFVKVWGGGFQRAGVPDLLICYKGEFIGIELKNEKGKASELQLQHLLAIAKAGGRSLILKPDNLQDLWDTLSEIDDRRTKETS